MGTATVLIDTLISQAKSAISRAFVGAGLLPSLTLLIGLRIYARGVAALRGDLDLLFASSRDLGVRGVFYLALIGAIACLFYAGRNITLRFFQTMDAPGLYWLRQLLISRQVRNWWSAERKKLAIEARLTPVNCMLTGEFSSVLGEPILTPQGISAALASAKTARESVASKGLFAFPDVRRSEIGLIVDGVVALFRLAPADSGAERDQWRQLLEQTNARFVLKRVHAEVTRDLLRHWSPMACPIEELWLAPTGLGNQLAALDDYGAERYKISTGSMWMRLVGVVDAAERAEVSKTQLAVQTSLNMSVAFVLVALGGIVSSVFEAARAQSVSGIVDLRKATVILLALFLGVCAYNAAIAAFDAVSESIRRLIDLHRLKLLKALGYAAPKNVEEELLMFKELSQFFENATPRPPARELVAVGGAASGAQPARPRPKITL